MAETCFHCGAPLRDPARQELVIDGERAAFCSPSCYEIAERIRDDGLARFYRFRAGPTPPAPGTGGEHERWRSYDRPALQKEFVTTHRDGSREAQLLVQGVRCAA